MSFRVSCGSCSGKGWINHHLDICAVCKGEGHLVVEGSSSDFAPCESCKGDGWIENRHGTCPACGGVGKLRRS